MTDLTQRLKSLGVEAGKVTAWERWMKLHRKAYPQAMGIAKADAALEELVTALELAGQRIEQQGIEWDEVHVMLESALARAEAAEKERDRMMDEMYARLNEAEADLAAMTENHRQAMIGIGELNDDLAAMTKERDERDYTIKLLQGIYAAHQPRPEGGE